MDATAETVVAFNESTATFYCLHCGYDLAGHTGDERRCPECGRQTTREAFELAQRVADEPIRAFEPPVIPSLIILPTLFMSIPLFAAGLDLPLYVLLFECGLWAWWLFSIYWFLRKYRAHHDRYWFLICSHLFTLIGTFGIQGASVAGISMMTSRRMLVSGLVTAGIAVLLVVLAVCLYRDMKRRLPVYKLVQSACTIAAG